jgi:endothelin-converting enzyme/putative endopeptidase
MRRLLIASVLLLSACGSEKPADVAAAKPVYPPFGVDMKNVDPAVKPGDDFYTYVNGAWLSTFKIPGDRPAYGIANILSDKAEVDVRDILDGFLKDSPPAGSSPAKLAALYSAWMDEAGIEARGPDPLKADLAKIDGLTDKTALLTQMAQVDYSAPFSIGLQADPDDPTKYAVWLGQSGLGMPNRDYYLLTGETYDRYRSAYKTYIAKLFSLMDDKDADKKADAIVALETKMATVAWTPERQRNVKEAVNPMDLAGLQKLAPAVNWSDYLKAAGLPDVKRVIVSETTAIRDGAKLIADEPLDTWKAYLAFHIASDYAQYLPKAFDDARFEFYSKTLRGIETQRDRWKRGVALSESLMGEAVGEAYVAKHYPPETKAKVDELVANLRTAMGERLKTLSWMDDPTRAEALKKLSTFDPRVGYPEKWRDYSNLAVEPGKLYEDVHAAHVFEWNRQVARIDQPVDRTEWVMNVPEVNAYYDPLMNQITFPAGILQPPFFDPNADPAVNYGGIGAVIGHEMGHGFDDQGREFDETGKIRNWWTPDTDTKFKAATDRLAAQFDSYCPLPNTCVKGQLTMGENIGDLGGLEMAYTAYKLSLNGKEAPVIEVDGVKYTGDQRFFLSYAQSWLNLYRDDMLRQLVLTNPHAPDIYRTNGAVRNIDAWYDAFGIKEGDKLYLPPDQRVHIW